MDLLPENAPKKHTLITTLGIRILWEVPAEPLQIPLFDMEESVELLSTLSNIVIFRFGKKENRPRSL